MPVEVDKTIAALEMWVERVRVTGETIPEDGAEALQRLGRLYAPKLTGQLASSIAITRDGPGSRLIGPTVVYGRIRELGGRIPQEPMTHPFLRWFSGGRAVYARRVHQRGTRYMLKALVTYAPRYRDLAYDEWAKTTVIP